tara:strand:- start:23700 stop:24416 length:717 start_codon:yes stop_codon:yes gene_type:complete
MLPTLQSCVTQLRLLIFAVSAAAISPLIATKLGLSMSLMTLIIICASLWIQEAYVIQYKFKNENIQFTRRFYDNFGDSARVIGFLPWILSLSIVCYLGLLVKGDIGFEGWTILVLGFFTMIRIFDPLLGCLLDQNSIALVSILGYFVIFTFAISSSLDPSLIHYLSGMPKIIVQGFLFGLVVWIILNIRFAYYQRFCFLSEQSLERQLNLILLKLLILALIQSAAIAEKVNLGIILGR